MDGFSFGRAKRYYPVILTRMQNADNARRAFDAVWLCCERLADRSEMVQVKRVENGEGYLKMYVCEIFLILALTDGGTPTIISIGGVTPTELQYNRFRIMKGDKII